MREQRFAFAHLVWLNTDILPADSRHFVGRRLAQHYALKPGR